LQKRLEKTKERKKVSKQCDLYIGKLEGIMNAQSVGYFEYKSIERREVYGCAFEVTSPLTTHSIYQSLSLTVNIWQRTPGPNAEDLFVGIKRGV
jgi:hypothetical protein